MNRIRGKELYTLLGAMAAAILLFFPHPPGGQDRLFIYRGHHLHGWDD